MKNIKFIASAIVGLATVTIAAAPAMAGKKAPVELTKCDVSYGTIAVVDGEAILAAVAVLLTFNCQFWPFTEVGQ